MFEKRAFSILIEFLKSFTKYLYCQPFLEIRRNTNSFSEITFRYSFSFVFFIFSIIFLSLVKLENISIDLGTSFIFLFAVIKYLWHFLQQIIGKQTFFVSNLVIISDLLEWQSDRLRLFMNLFILQWFALNGNIFLSLAIFFTFNWIFTVDTLRGSFLWSLTNFMPHFFVRSHCCYWFFHGT